MTFSRRRRSRPALLLGVLLSAGLIVPILASGAAGADLPPEMVQHDFEFAGSRLTATAGTTSPTAYPIRTNTSGGGWLTSDATGWTSGFFPGLLWEMYERTGDPAWKTRAQSWQAGLESQKFDNSTHDIGFQIFSSFGNGYRLTGTDTYRQVMLTAAATLATRYKATVGAIRSWDPLNDTTQYRVIVDNMMNLELLYSAAANGGSQSWHDMAVNHALRTSQDFVRPDGSTWHVVNYNQNTGTVLSKTTHQGYSNNSTWSRGQAWAVHGFTTSYRYTGDARFLDTARATADYFINHLPPDKVPYWDFSLPSTTGEPRDSSAAAIAASGLLELSQLDTDPVRRQTYFDTARDILASLSSPAYLADGTSNPAVLLHGTQNKPAGSYDTGVIFGDYYFLEALSRYEQIVATADPPVADFAANATVGTSPLSVQFTDLSANNPTSWQWNFGDAGSGALNTSTIRNPSHTYSTAGVYDVTLTATNASGNHSVTKTGYVTVQGDVVPPGAPTNLVATGSVGTVSLTWTAATDNVGVTGYTIHRSSTPGFTPLPANEIGQTSATSYVDSGLPPATYFYRVLARDAAGNLGPSSNEATAASIAADVTPPTVGSTTPASGASAVSSGVAPTATFGEAIQSGVGTFTLQGPGATNVAGASSFGANAITFTPSAALAGSTTFTATVSGVKDLAGNTMASSTSWSFTTEAASTSTVTVDKTVFKDGAGNQTTAAFSSAGPGELLVAFVSADGPASGAQTATVSGAGVSWSLARRTNVRPGTSEVWVGFSSTGLTGATVKSTLGQAGYHQSLTVVLFQGAIRVGASASANAASGAPSVSLTTTQANSLVYAVGNDRDAAIARTVPIGQTKVHEWVDTAATDTFWVQRRTATVPTPTSVTINDTAPTADRWNFTGVEIVAAASDVSPPSVTATVPVGGVSGVAVSAAPSATFGEAIQSGVGTFTLQGPGATNVPGAVSFGANVITFTPSAALAASTTFTATVSGVKDLAGNTMAGPTSWSFTTTASAGCPCSLWASSTTPATVDAADAGANVELGVKFTADVSGFVTGVRFYKAAANNGTHTGTLWSSTGAQLATVTFSGETASGWQVKSFASRVAVTAGTTYVVSYHTTVGHYSFTGNYFASTYNNNLLHAPSSGASGGNGVFRYGNRAFPNQTYQSGNYWVDVVFTTT